MPSGSAASRRCSSSNRSATLRSGTRAKSKRCVRERIVSGSFCGSVVAKTNTRCGGGSSSVFSSAAKASPESWWISSMMTTRCLPPVGEKRTFSRSACTSAMPRFEAPSISVTSSATPVVISRHETHSLQGSPALWPSRPRCWQLSALAIRRAQVVLPTPRTPVKR